MINKTYYENKRRNIERSNKENFKYKRRLSLHDAVMKAMEEYAQQQVKKCSVPAVSGQSEQYFCPKEQIGQRCNEQCL